MVVLQFWGGGLKFEKVLLQLISESCKPLSILCVCAFVPRVGRLDPGFLASDKPSPGNTQINEEINITSSDSEVEIVGVQEHARYELLPLTLFSFSISLVSSEYLCVAKIGEERIANLPFLSYPPVTGAPKAENITLVTSVLLATVTSECVSQ